MFDGLLDICLRPGGVSEEFGLLGLKQVLLVRRHCIKYTFEMMLMLFDVELL